MVAPVLSTYRLQLSGGVFGFADAIEILDYLDELGVSHLYLSPILTAERGSTHGYDMVDPTAVSAELGGAEGLAALSAAARDRGMGLIVDIVPNHVGVGRPEQNPWWWDVLARGRGSRFAEFFDIDWEADPDGRILLPVLGSDADIAALEVHGSTLRLGDLVFPIAEGTGAGLGAEVHDRQHYRLTGWRTGRCGYRRFFSITSLAGLRQEDRNTFDASHIEVQRWFDEQLVDGVRVDHPDGLTDPVRYLERLRKIVGSEAYVVIEKILAADEALDPALSVQGTTGYDVLREIGGLFLDPEGEPRLTELCVAAGAAPGAPEVQIAELKSQAATITLASELARVHRAVARAAGADHPRLSEAITALLTHLDVYRCDYPAQSAMLSTAIAETVAAAPNLADPLQLIAAAVEFNEPAARLQQLCGAVTAKAVEDCLFYRDARLVSRNEVGGAPARFAVSAAEFHHSAAIRGRLWPLTMTTLSTHDTKRGEDVRARIGVLSQVPDLWAEHIARWNRMAPAPDPGTGLFLWQNVFGVWPADGTVDEIVATRLHAYAEKAIREAGLRTSWHDPDQDFEAGVHRWLDEILTVAADDLTALVARLDPHGRSDALGQKLLALTVPGVPDVYQGTELWEDSLVDPDNRRPVDYAVRRAALAALTTEAHPKLRVVRAALRLRRERPESFRTGSYRPVLATGAAAAHLVAFRRGGDVLAAVSRWTIRLAESGWQDTELPLPTGEWIDRMTGRRFGGSVAASELFDELPAALLVRDG